MNVNNNINNNPIHHAPGVGQANAPVNVPNIQQVAPQPAPQGMHEAPAAGDMYDDYDPVIDHMTAMIVASFNDGRVYDAAICYSNDSHLVNNGPLLRNFGLTIASNWHNGEQDIEPLTQQRIDEHPPFMVGGRQINVEGNALNAFGLFFCALPNQQQQNEVINLIANKQNLDAGFRREVVENFMADENPDKAELMNMLTPRRFHSTKSARK